MRLKTIAVLSLGTVLACAEGTAPVPRPLPMAPTLATVERDHDVMDFTQTVNNTCAGEMVRVSGRLQVIDQVVTMANGEIRTVFHTNFLGATGVGLTSGKKYRASIVDNSTWQGAPAGGGIQGGPFRTSHAGTLHLVVPGEGASFNLHFVFIVTKEPGSPFNLIVAKSEVTCH
jgi:hypothetical protein